MQCVSGTINLLGELREGAAARVVDIGDLVPSPGRQVAADQIHRGVIFAGEFQNQDLMRSEAISSGSRPSASCAAKLSSTLMPFGSWRNSWNSAWPLARRRRPRA